MAAVPPLLLSDQSLEDIQVSRTLFTCSPWREGWLSTALHGFGGLSATSILYDHLSFVFKTHSHCSPGRHQAACSQISQTAISSVPWVWCLALADNPEHGHLLWHMDTGCGHLSLPRAPKLRMGRCYLLLLWAPQPPWDCHHCGAKIRKLLPQELFSFLHSGVSVLGITGLFFLPTPPFCSSCGPVVDSVSAPKYFRHLIFFPLLPPWHFGVGF